MGCIQKKGDTVQPQSQGQIPTGAALLNDGKYGLNKEKDRAQLQQERQNIRRSIFFQNAIMLIYGARVYVYPDFLRPDFTVHLFGMAVPGVRLLVIAASVLLMLGLSAFIQRTRTGAAIRAVAIDPGAARLMGINVDRVISLVFLIGPGLGGAAGLMVGIYYGQIDFTMGWSYGLKAFTAAILGGIGNIPGAMLGGLLLGVIEALAAGYIAIAWKDAIAFLVLILILIIRPTGILGERTADKL